jgi:hypothetical protein
MMASTAATPVCFQQGTSVGGLLPADIDGLSAPPAGSPNYLMYYGTNVLNLYKFHVDFVTTSNSTFTGPTAINVAAFSPVCGGGTCIPQPSTTQQLDSLADRLMYRLAYRNFGTHESLVVSHSVIAGSGGGVRWYEIQNPSGTPTVAQQSTFAPASNYRWMPSVAMDQQAIWRWAIASGGPVRRQLICRPRAIRIVRWNRNSVVAGSGHAERQQLSVGATSSAMQVDPVDDCTSGTQGT